MRLSEGVLQSYMALISLSLLTISVMHAQITICAEQHRELRLSNFYLGDLESKLVLPK